MLPGARVTPRILPPGKSLDAVHWRGSWDAHSPFITCTNPACCDTIDDLRRQSGVDSVLT